LTPLLRRAALLLVLAAAACSGGGGAYYPVRATVVATAPERNEVTLAHEPIAGFMDAMTMPFPVARRQLLDGVAAGDAVEGVLLVEGGRTALIALAKRAGAAPSAAAPAP